MVEDEWWIGINGVRELWWRVNSDGDKGIGRVLEDLGERLVFFLFIYVLVIVFCWLL